MCAAAAPIFTAGDKMFSMSRRHTPRSCSSCGQRARQTWIFCLNPAALWRLTCHARCTTRTQCASMNPSPAGIMTCPKISKAQTFLQTSLSSGIRRKHSSRHSAVSATNGLTALTGAAHFGNLCPTDTRRQPESSMY